MKHESVLTRAMGRARAVIVRVALFGFFINLLMLTAPLYMLQVYDRVLASRSQETLIFISLFALGCLITMALLEVVRSRILVQLGAQFDSVLAGPAFRVVLTSGKSGQILRDVESVRAFLTGIGILTLLDAPWTPLYVALVYVLHPALGHVALAGAIVLVAIGVFNEWLTRKPLAEASKDLASSTQFAELCGRNCEVVKAMGMLSGLQMVWRKRHASGLRIQAIASDRAGATAAIAKMIRFLLQIAILGVGAYLVIQQEITAGVMIAASIIMGRGLAPVESAIGNWRTFLAARASYERVSRTMHALQDRESMPLPAPRGNLAVESLYGAPPGINKSTVANISFQLPAGKALGITGHSGAGKSSLVRLLIGVWAPLAGSVRLDGVNLSDWDREQVGPYIGYLPQDIELFPGTVAENIARFGKLAPDQVVEAARSVGAHQMILELPDGYDTILGPNGANLSGGQRQRIGLARALYGSPSLIVLDEPTSNLDADGEASVRQVIEQLRRAAKTVIVIAHRPALLGGTDLLMVMQRGFIVRLGPAHEIIPQITRPVGAPADGGALTEEVAHGV